MVYGGIILATVLCRGVLQVGDPNNIRITITNDGATILRSVPVENPAAKVLVDIARIQDDTVGDGTTRYGGQLIVVYLGILAPDLPLLSCSVTVLCGELLREAEFLVNQRVHPMTIVQGWRLAVQIARSALEQAAVDNSADQARFKEDLMNIARTTLSSKLLNVEKDHFAGLAVEAVLRLKGSGNLDYIQVRSLEM
jgi:T-complex protein 1 subunit beta